MSKLIGRNNVALTPRQALEQKVSSARANLLLVIIFTAINMILLVANAGSYFLFSASVPYLLTLFGLLLCGMLPAEYYAELEGFVPLDKSVFIIALALAILILGLYLLCWFLSKKNKVGWLIFALVLFSIDTLALFNYYGFAADSFFDIAFHIWIIVILALGIDAHYKLKKMPDEPAPLTVENPDGEIMEAEPGEGESNPLRPVDPMAKARILLEADAYNYHIEYRRVKSTNELVINGKVYDEYTAVMELPHLLSATVDGHRIEAGIDNVSRMSISVDGEIVKKKIRLI
jgi:hypothetical protein